MTNYVPINNTILRDIVRCLQQFSQYWSRFMNKRVGLVFDEKHTVFRVIIKVTEKLVIIR